MQAPRGSRRRGVVDAACAILLLLGASAAEAATFTVTNNANGGAGSLRQAITDARLNPGADVIDFAIAGSTDITLTSGLTILDNGLTIDGSSQAGIKVILSVPTPAFGDTAIFITQSTDIVVQDIEVAASPGTYGIRAGLSPFSGVRSARVAVRRVVVSGFQWQVSFDSVDDGELRDSDLGSGTALHLGRSTGFKASGNDYGGASVALFLQLQNGLTVAPSIPAGPGSYVVFEPTSGIDTVPSPISALNSWNITVRDVDLGDGGPGRVGGGIGGGRINNLVVENVIINDRSSGVSVDVSTNLQVTNNNLSSNDVGLSIASTGTADGVKIQAVDNVFTGCSNAVSIDRPVPGLLLTDAVPPPTVDHYIVLDEVSDLGTVGTPVTVGRSTGTRIENIDFSGNPGVGGTSVRVVGGNASLVIDGVIASDRGNGITVRNDHSPTTIRCSRIENNSGIGVLTQDGNNLRQDTILVDNFIGGNGSWGVDGNNRTPGRTIALNNYWGAPDGPSTLGGSGDDFRGTVDASPFSVVTAGCVPVTNLPPTAACRDIGVTADDTCSAQVAVADVDAGSSDPDGSADIDTLCVTAVNGVPVPCGTSATLSGLGAHVVTLTITDLQGLSDSCDATVVVTDVTAPSISGVPANLTVDCNAVPPEASPTASDNCDPAPVLSFLETRMDGACGDDYVLLRTWTARDASGNESTAEQRIEVIDLTGPDVTAALEPVAPLPASSADVAGSVCSAPATRTFTVFCSATDDCDDEPNVAAVLLAIHHDVAARDTCDLRIDEIDVDCGEIVELHLVAPHCPSKPRSARSSLTVNSLGVKVVTGESIVLEVTGIDRCGNESTVEFDPAVEPSPLCDEVLDDGRCCPAIGQPAAPKCELAPCAETSPATRVGVPSRSRWVPLLRRTR